MHQRLLLIINPNSGTKRANKYLTDIISIFNADGWECTVYTTAKHGDGTRIVKEKCRESDLVVCIGGDGTFNEIVSGVIQCGKTLPVIFEQIDRRSGKLTGWSDNYLEVAVDPCGTDCGKIVNIEAKRENLCLLNNNA
jgi:diacylglycerol kinase family enzyme